MKTIRRHTFETNSSSCHSITFGYNVGTIYPKELPMMATAYYCGQGELSSPEDKADYFSVAMMENFSRILMDMKAEYYKNAFAEKPDIFTDIFNFNYEIISGWKVSSLPTPRSMRAAFLKMVGFRLEEISDYFLTKGVRVIFDDGKNHGISICQSEYSPDYKKVFSYPGNIDHESSPLEEVEDAIKLAELPVEKLFDFIYATDSSINCEYNG